MEDNSKIFHLGLCMAGSISAGAYTAGVMDHLIEVLENWEKNRGQSSVPDHRVVIDLLCGASGGGITSAISLFAIQDKLDHVRLAADGKSYQKPNNNILWDSWVELSGKDVFAEILGNDDLQSGYVSSAINSGFVEKVAENFRDYITQFSERGGILPPYLSEAAEAVLTLFNVTGISYKLYSKAPSGARATNQYIFEHRDLAHFRLSEQYKNDGRIPISLRDLKHVSKLIEASMATGAYPLGLKARKFSREAKFIWDNPFFHRGLFDRSSIGLGKKEMTPDEVYTSLNGDGGVANNEPVELARTLLRTMRAHHYGDLKLSKELFEMSEEDKEDRLKEMTNTSVLLIDPFPSTNSVIKLPADQGEHLFRYGPDLIMAMRSQLLFDAKEALKGYDKENYALHVIAPSREGVEPPKALACASLGGFGGFLHKEFRIHDYFLGRHNCQSFLRKYFVVDPNEENPEARQCVQAVIDGYNGNQEALKRFSFKDERGKTWVPVIPDLSMTRPIEYRIENGKGYYQQENVLPVYKLDKLPETFPSAYTPLFRERISALVLNLFPVKGLVSFALKAGVGFFKKGITNKLVNRIREDFKERDLM